VEEHIKKRGWGVLLACGFVFLAVAPLRSQDHEDKDAIKNGWILNLDDGIKQAEKSGKPLMVVLRCVP
jgi:hypothetical protein